MGEAVFFIQWIFHLADSLLLCSLISFWSRPVEWWLTKARSWSITKALPSFPLHREKILIFLMHFTTWILCCVLIELKGGENTVFQFSFDTNSSKYFSWMQLFRNEMAEEWQQIWLTIDKCSRELSWDVHLVVNDLTWAKRKERFMWSNGKTRWRRRHRPNEWHLIAFPIGALSNLIESVSVKAWCIYYEKENPYATKCLRWEGWGAMNRKEWNGKKTPEITSN